jgi:hypothetical protein
VDVEDKDVPRLEKKCHKMNGGERIVELPPFSPSSAVWDSSKSTSAVCGIDSAYFLCYV